MRFQILVCLLILQSTSSDNDFQHVHGEKCITLYTWGYNYRNWYNVTEFAVDTAANKTDLFLKFYVQGMSDAHVMLTAEPSVFGYEIVLGGGNNSFCDLRKSAGSASKFFIKVDKMMDSFNPVGFWIRVSRSYRQSGLIEVGKDGDNLPFMFWEDPTPINVKYFSFSSWDTVVCKWLFNCQTNASLPGSADKIGYTGKFLTYTERLRRDVLKSRGAFSASSPPTANAQQLLNVEITVNFKSIHLDVMTSTLTLQGFANFKWSDYSIRWNPGNYRNISKLHLSNYELWQPELVLHNALDPTVSMFSEEKISIDNLGQVTWRPKFNLKTKCNIDLKSWPWDRHKCTVLLSTWSHKISNIFYEIIDNNKSECFQVAHSDWKLDQMTSSYVEESTPWDDILASINNVDGSEDSKQISLQLVVEISRNTKILEKLFHVPLILISCLWLSSFWLVPNSASKITTISVSVITSILVVVYMTTYVPVFTEYPPNLLMVYLKLMFLMSTDALISSFLITVHSRKTTSGHPPFVMTRFFTTPIVTKILVLPKLDLTPSIDYSQFGKEDGTPETTVTLWDIVVVAFERIIFITYLVITVIILSSINN